MKPENAFIHNLTTGRAMATWRVFFMSAKYETLERQWFALHCGELYSLGDCGDFEAALEVARDTLGEDQGGWIAPYGAVAAWCDVLNSVRARFD